MYEKYNALEVGVGGGGGEYVPQVGFGWTNGVILSMIHTSKHLKCSSLGSSPESFFNSKIFFYAQIVIIILTSLSLMYYGYSRYKLYRERKNKVENYIKLFEDIEKPLLSQQN